MTVDINKFEARQKKTTHRAHRMNEEILKKYKTIIETNKHSTHNGEEHGKEEKTSEKENNNYYQLSQKIKN